ncbi:hypothetical protein [Novipirellula rosea]|uniref:DUF883 domain-containing protein n=2 Tax=Novipirellula TaxID=2795426 RepID=A0ABP8MPN0_9BACT
MNSPTMRSEKSGQRTGSTASPTTQAAAEKLQECSTHYVTEPAKDIMGRLSEYAHEKPDVAAMWCFGLGLIVGWKLRG